MRDKEDDDVWGLKDDKRNLEFIFDWSIKMERITYYFNKN